MAMTKTELQIKNLAQANGVNLLGIDGDVDFWNWSGTDRYRYVATQTDSDGNAVSLWDDYEYSNLPPPNCFFVVMTRGATAAETIERLATQVALYNDESAWAQEQEARLDAHHYADDINP